MAMKIRWRTIAALVLGLTVAPVAVDVTSNNLEFLVNAYAQEQEDPEITGKKHLSFGYRYFKQAEAAKEKGDEKDVAQALSEAETQFKKAYSYIPNDGRVAYYLGRIYDESERYDEAIEWFNKAIQLLPITSPNLNNSYFFLAQIHTIQDNRKAAINAYDRLLEMSTDPKQKIQYLNCLVSLSVEEEDFVRALVYARQWGELEPENAEVRDTIAKLAILTGSASEAIAEKEKVLDINPNDWESLEWLGNQYRKRGDYQKAFDAYIRLQIHDQSNFAYLDNLLELSIHLKKPSSYQAAILTKMYNLQPQNLRTIELLADHTGSIEWIDKGLKLDPQNGRLNYLKGEFHYKRWKQNHAGQDSVQALSWYERAKADPQWKDNAQRMIWELNPPLTEEERIKREFFEKKKSEEVDVEGKK